MMRSKQTPAHILFIALTGLMLTNTLASCKNSYEKEVYGSYSKAGDGFSRIIFYPNNTYGFHSQSAVWFDDSGSFVLRNDQITFQSFNSYPIDTLFYPAKGLTGFEFIYKTGKVFYINRAVTPDKHLKVDTVFLKKDPARNN